MTAVDAEPLAWDPLDEKYKVDPHPIWKRLRDEAPLYYNEQHDFYAVSRFADVDAFSRDPKTFCSSHGTVMEMITAERTSMEIMIFMDPPEHTRYRRLVSKAFTPRRMTELEEDIRSLCASLLDGLVGRSSFDYVQDFGAKVPAYVIAALLGVPPEERDMVRHWIDVSFTLDPEKGMYNDVSAAAMLELHNYMTAVLNDRRKNPRDDMFTDLVNLEIVDDDGELRRLTTDQAVNFAVLIGSAGTETVARLLGWAALTLDNNPDQRTELVATPELIPNAVEELLRYEAPSPSATALARSGPPSSFSWAPRSGSSWPGPRKRCSPRRRRATPKLGRRPGGLRGRPGRPGRRTAPGPSPRVPGLAGRPALPLGRRTSPRGRLSRASQELISESAGARH